MKKISLNPSPDANNIELPLLPKLKSDRSSFIDKAKPDFIKYFDTSSPPSKYIQKVSFWGFLTFFDVLPFIKLINRKQTKINMSDLPLAFDYCNIDRKVVALDTEWKVQITKDQPSFINTVMKVFKKSCLSSACWDLCLLLLSLLLQYC